MSHKHFKDCTVSKTIRCYVLAVVFRLLAGFRKGFSVGSCAGFSLALSSESCDDVFSGFTGTIASSAVGIKAVRYVNGAGSFTITEKKS